MEQTLETLSIGTSTVINGIHVTRWSDSEYEVGTYGQYKVERYEAIEILLS